MTAHSRTGRRMITTGWLLAGLLATLALDIGVLADDKAIAKHPGYVNGEVFADMADEDGKLIEVNLRGKLLNVLIRRAVQRHDEGLAAILGGLVSMRAVIAEPGENQGTIEHRMYEIKADLDRRGWERFVRIRENRDEDYAAYVHYRDDDEANFIDGLVVLGFTGGDEMLFINLVGKIDMEQIALLSERFGVPGLNDWMPPQEPRASGGTSK